MTTKFSFKSFDTKYIGIIKKPFATIKITCESYTIRANFLIDSGADITIIPRELGEKGLGFSIKKGERIINLGGAGGGVIPVLIRKVKIEIGNEIVLTKIGWALIDTVSLILGRLDIFRKFHIEFREDEGITIFQRQNKGGKNDKRKN